MLKNNDKNNRNLYLRVDDAIMKEVNKVVRAWNWTTGGTKSSLANTMLRGSLVLQTAAACLSTNLYVPVASIMMIRTHVSQMRENKTMEKREVNAINNGVLDPEVESFKDLCKVIGPSAPALCAGVEVLEFMKHGTRDAELFLLGYIALTGPSFYVMRAECLPPRKNAFARGWENLKTLQRTPALQPLRIPVQYSSTLRT